jgi:SAM-dependent methyltransferase
VPPEPLRYLISGIPDYPVSDFLQMGQHCASIVEKTLLKNGVQLAALGTILDFGCGCGRTLRHLAHLKQTQLHGTDYNPALVGWCRPNLAFAEFAVNGLEPPLAYGDSNFDLVYAFSVFSHLPEPLQHAWMQEMRRVIKPNGHLLLSTLSAGMLAAQYGDEEQQRFARGELVVVNPDDPGGNTCSAFHPDEYMRKQLARGFVVRDFVSGGLGQDVWLLRKETSASVARLHLHPQRTEGSQVGPLT